MFWLFRYIAVIVSVEPIIGKERNLEKVEVFGSWWEAVPVRLMRTYGQALDMHGSYHRKAHSRTVLYFLKPFSLKCVV